jgi:hypothetical protein
MAIDFSSFGHINYVYNANVQTLHTNHHCPNYDR